MKRPDPSDNRLPYRRAALFSVLILGMVSRAAHRVNLPWAAVVGCPVAAMMWRRA